jgi:hypothetical protein
MTNPSGSPLRRRVDFRNDLLPLLYAEMQVRFYVHSALRQSGVAASTLVRDQLALSWASGTFARAIDRLEPTYGSFDPASVVFADDGAHFDSSAAYQSHVYEMVESDLSEAVMPGGSPVKAALEVTRILRDQMRGVIEYGGLSMRSFIDFQSNIRGRINRIEAGPPPVRSQQLLGLIEAGVVKVPFGPYPEVSTQGLVDVVDEVVDVLEPDGQPDGLRPDAGAVPLVGQLAVGGRGRVDGQRLGVPQVEQPLEQLQRVEEGQAGLVAPGGPEGDDGRDPPLQVALDQVW